MGNISNQWQWETFSSKECKHQRSIHSQQQSFIFSPWTTVVIIFLGLHIPAVAFLHLHLRNPLMVEVEALLPLVELLVVPPQLSRH